jgi:hypothetical protein
MHTKHKQVTTAMMGGEGRGGEGMGGMVWYGMVWYGMVWYGMGWDGTAICISVHTSILQWACTTLQVPFLQGET